VDRHRRITGETDCSREIDLLWRYVAGTAMPAGVPAIYETTLRTHKLQPGDLEGRGMWTLGALDAGTRLLRPTCTLQRKLLIAAALYEASPSSADALLPRRRSWIGIFASLTGAALVTAWKLLLFVILILPRGRGFLDQNAGR
jgi:hypothetical protein